MASATKLFWLTVCTCLALGIASPTKKKLVETTPDTAESATREGDNWDDSDGDFDFKDTIIGRWVDQVLTSSAAPYLLTPDYEESDDDDDGDDEDFEIDRQDGEENIDSNNNNNNQDSEFLFMSPKENRLVLEDDDGDQSGLIKVRHSSKTSYSEPQKDTGENSIETNEKGDSDSQFVVTLDELDDGDDNNDYFVLDGAEKKSDNNNNADRQTKDDEDGTDDDDSDDDANRVDDDNDDDDDQDDEDLFENPEEDAQVIYGDHVFLY